MARAFLKIVAGAKQGLNVPLTEGAELLIGRSKGDLILDDTMISGQHAKLKFKDGVWQLRDLGSTNGTMVDGRLTREATLRPGAEITVGNTRLVLLISTEEETAADLAEQPNPPHAELAWLLEEELVELKGSPERTGSAADAIGQDLRLPPGLNALVEVVAGQDTGKVFRFTRGNVVVGRKMGEIPLSDPEASRRHAVIELFGREMIFLRDLGSTNGTFHNGRKVSAARLRAGDTIGVGKTVMRLNITL